MKKGLLGLVVAALTVVGCQNYDDQFDDLNKKIAALSTEVTSLSSVQTAVTALGTKLDNLAGSALTDSDLAGILDEVAAVKAAVAAIDNSAVEAEVADLNTEVDEILEKLGELLAANAVIPGDLVISNLGELAAAQELIGTEADDPLVTIQGNVHVSISSSNGLKDSIAAVNAITNKIKIAQGTVTATTHEPAVTLNELMYITGNYATSGNGSVAAPKLRTVNGTVVLASNGFSYPLLSSATSIKIDESSAQVTATTVDFSGYSSGDVFTTSGALLLPNATSVKVGGTLPVSVTLAKAVEFVASKTGTQTGTHIVVGGTAATFSLAATKFAGTVTITTTGAINLSAITEAAALNVAATDIDLSGMTKFTGVTTLSATTVNIGAMVSSTDTVTLVGPTAVSLPALTALGGNFVAGSATSFSAPKLATSTGTIDLKNSAALEVTLKSLTATTTLLDIAKIKTLTLAGQATSVTMDDFADMTTLNYTGAHPSSITPGSHVGSNNLTITSSNASLTILSIGDGGIGTLTVSGTNLESLSTLGHIINTVVQNNAKLESFDFGHRHADGDDATTISITGNTDPALTSIDLSSLAKVKHVNITGNTSLTTIVAPSAAVLAEPLATVTVTINNNATVGTYTAAVSATETTVYKPATASAAVVTAFKPFIEAYLAQTRTASVSFDIDVDKVTVTGSTGTVSMSTALNSDGAAVAGPDGVAGGTDAQTNGANGVDTKAELSLF